VIDRANIGKSWPPWEVEVEKGRLQLFAKAIGETRPIYTDDGAAKAAGFRGILAPPTYPVCLGADDPKGLQYLTDLGVPMGRMLHGEQRIHQVEPICAGDRLLVTRRVRDIYDKKGGALEFIVFESEVHNRATDRVVARTEAILAIRNP
jgi:acyl dehydratase